MPFHFHFSILLQNKLLGTSTKSRKNTSTSQLYRTCRKEKADAVLDSSKEDGLVVNAEKTKNAKYVIMSCHQNAVQNHNINIPKTHIPF